VAGGGENARPHRFRAVVHYDEMYATICCRGRCKISNKSSLYKNSTLVGRYQFCTDEELEDGVCLRVVVISMQMMTPMRTKSLGEAMASVFGSELELGSRSGNVVVLSSIAICKLKLQSKIYQI
jgi:hypothetical protein